MNVSISFNKEEQAIIKRFAEERGMTQADAAKKIASIGIGRQRALFNQADKKPASEKKPRVKKEAKAKTGPAKKAKAKAATKTATKKSAGKASGTKTTKTAKAKASKTAKTENGNGAKAAENGNGAKLDVAAIKRFKDEGFSNADIAEQLGISKDQVYRALKK